MTLCRETLNLASWFVILENFTPQAGTPEHVRENHGAASIKLTEQDLVKLDRAFPPPHRKQPLAVL